VTLVVSDTGPLNYLLLCGVVDLLPALFDKVVVPPAVVAELQDEGAPDIVRSWACALPQWVGVRSPARVESQPDLDYGEQEAIALALEIDADVVLMDDLAARSAAKQHGLNVIGTLGLLVRAAENGLADLPTILRALAATTFRIDPKLIREALQRDARRKGE
jgi:predicted nucleic acid-binding protein